MYLTVNPRDLQPGWRIPGAGDDGPTVASVGDPYRDDRLGCEMVLVAFAEDDAPDREIPTEFGVWTWVPDEDAGEVPAGG
jgi:hypothetical protein